ncbi:hypothetical protein [Brachybacterium sp. GPGPB12]|uniref:hypothetical protein n=1 Tax=Brachybacterium sp. GPGPB12 TaxID=3023517 RepID=UPI0031343ACA
MNRATTIPVPMLPSAAAVVTAPLTSWPEYCCRLLEPFLEGGVDHRGVDLEGALHPLQRRLEALHRAGLDVVPLSDQAPPGEGEHPRDHEQQAQRRDAAGRGAAQEGVAGKDLDHGLERRGEQDRDEHGDHDGRDPGEPPQQRRAGGDDHEQSPRP